jgi:hypothetical protein
MMTDHELLRRVLSCIDPAGRGLRLVRRNRRVLLAVPEGGEAVARTLGLYQPQRPAAGLMMAGLRCLARFSLHGGLLSKIHLAAEPTPMSPALAGIDPGTCGVLLGSPEHRVRRAIASYRRDGVWEVAKVSFGEAGRANLEREALVLADLHGTADAVPPLLGIHRAEDLTLLRMPYLIGRAVPCGQPDGAIGLLESWVTDNPPQGIEAFPEWDAIRNALNGCARGTEALDVLSPQSLCPMIRHGDFARWNLLTRGSGGLMALDWEWGHSGGMPGLDLAHYFLQDARLVDRLAPNAAIRKAVAAMEAGRCADYLARTGWSGNPMLPVVASLAFKQGAGHQDNAAILDAALLLMNENSSEQ